MQTQKDKQALFEQMNAHLLEDRNPSVYFEEIATTSFFSSEPFSLLNALKQTPQCKKYHPEGNVWNHTMLVIEEAALRKDQSKNARAFMWAALLHDIGKPATTQIKNGKITSYNHDIVGADIAKTFLETWNQNPDFIMQVVGLVRFHMQILFVVKNMKFARIEQMNKQSDANEVALLGLCDRLGRLNVDKELEQQNISEFLRKSQPSVK